MDGYMKFKDMKDKWKRNIYVYNPQMLEGKPYTTKKKKRGKAHVYGIEKSVDIINTGTRHPGSVIHFDSVHDTVHETQKPVDICEWLIKTYSKEGDVVLDFCMGSGTTAIACKNTGREFIGIEKNKKIYDVANSRIFPISDESDMENQKGEDLEDSE